MIGPICLCAALTLSGAPTPAEPDPISAALRYPGVLEAYVDRQAELDAQRAAEARQEARSEYRTPVSTGLDWAALRECESGGDYRINTGNGYYGAYQFSLSTCQAQGGSGLPSDAPPAEQDARAQRLYDAAGAGPWPTCGSLL